MNVCYKAEHEYTVFAAKVKGRHSDLCEQN